VKRGTNLATARSGAASRLVKTIVFDHLVGNVMRETHVCQDFQSRTSHCSCSGTSPAAGVAAELALIDHTLHQPTGAPAGRLLRAREDGGHRACETDQHRDGWARVDPILVCRPCVPLGAYGRQTEFALQKPARR
jgi:hypothetical protein